MNKNNYEQGIGTIVIIAIVAALGIGGVIALLQMSDTTMVEDDSVMRNGEALEMDGMDDDVSTESNASAGVEVGGAMMVPSLTIVENAMNADNVTTVVAAVSAAGLVETLQSEGPFTVFAPTDDAFAALPAGTVETLLLEENKEQLAAILTYHVVSGAYTSADLMDGQILTTVNGETILIGKTGNQISVNGSAMVETADVRSSNGVTFIIDAVLLPPEA